MLTWKSICALAYCAHSRFVMLCRLLVLRKVVTLCCCWNACSWCYFLFFCADQFENGLLRHFSLFSSTVEWFILTSFVYQFGKIILLLDTVWIFGKSLHTMCWRAEFTIGFYNCILWLINGFLIGTVNCAVCVLSWAQCCMVRWLKMS